MTSTVLVSGKLFRDPERKVSSAGKPYASVTIKDVNGDDVTWWKLLTFSEPAIEELLSLRDGDGIAASGSFRADVYDRGAGPKVGFTLFAERLISTRREKRERAQERQDRQRQRSSNKPAPRQPLHRELNDPLPEGWTA